jgi:hypothetical protein
MKKLLLLLALLPALALGQNYPSPTYKTLTLQNPLTVANGGTSASTASGTALDNITGFSATGFVTRTGAGAYAFQSLTNGITYANLAQASANTLLGNATGSTANVSAVAVTGCNGAAQALQWTSGSGFGCNSSIATSGANANITSLSGLTTALSVSQGGTGSSSLTQYNLLAGNGTSAVSTVSPGSTSGYVLTSNGSSSLPSFQYAAGRLIGVQVFTSSGTYTADSGTNSVIEELVGGGGGGGGIVAMPSGDGGASACGGAGGYIVTRLTSSFSGVTVTIGAGGTAGTTSGSAGGNGGSTSVGSLTAGGGTGGGGISTATGGPSNLAPGAGGTATGGNIVNAPGQYATTANYGNSSNYASYGLGGNTIYGSGAQTALNATGVAGKGYGSGGCGVIGTSSADTAYAGGAGTAGIVIVWEYN